MQETHFVFAKVDERSVDTRQNVFDRTGVYITQKQLAAIDEKLDHSVVFEQRRERYAQIGLTLEVEDTKFAEQMKLYMPAIRNSILMILAHKQSSELLERSGKEALAAEIMREAVRPMGIEIDPEPAAQAASGAEGKAAKGHKPAVHNPIRRVHFSSFIIQ